MKHAAVPAEELQVGSNLGVGTSGIAVVPARAVKLRREFWGRRLPDHPGVPPDAAGQARDPRVHERWGGGGLQVDTFGPPRGGKEG